MQFRKKFIMCLLCLIAFLDLATTIQAKSVYVINDTDASEMRAYKVEDANLVHQTEADYDFVSETWGPVGIAIDESDYGQFLFATFETSNEIELINAKTMVCEEKA